MNVGNKKISLLISTIASKLRENEAVKLSAPIYSISPSELKELCSEAELNHEEAYFLALMATAIVRGMLQNPEEISAIVNNRDGGKLGGSLIVACADMSINS